MEMGESMPVASHRCPECGYELDMSFPVSNEKIDSLEVPDDGAYMVCIVCSGIGVWEGGSTRHTTRKERREFLDSAERIELLIKILIGAHATQTRKEAERE
jgi:uncharacterized protein with PIN domain